MTTDAVLAATTTDDPAGLPPSRLITPYWRSKPVEIASDDEGRGDDREG